MMFQAWPVSVAQPVTIAISQTPAGRLVVFNWNRQSTDRVVIPADGCAMVLPVEPTRVSWRDVDFSLGVGCYAQVPGGALVRGGAGLIIYSPEYIGLAQAGGPVEASGRLNYIDGCSDSLLVCPAQLGEPCLNLLHLPPGIHQSAHTHPSERIGIILRGSGVCRTAAGDTLLQAGMFWFIPPEFVHSFHTYGDALDVLAWHPDSDFGPSHDAHPMINRTIVDGVPANDERHRGIRTT